ncbi:MAG: hypothetical protein CR975_02345 [Gammaproteobacteria bacterium]|nr:MAG: hypothetical protein CR975_02345 [Gammaproteobacteria bacterium]
MSQLDALLVKYTADLKNKCKVTPDADLLKKVAKGLGPSIYNKNSSLVSGSDKSELNLIKNNFLIKKLGLKDSDALDKAIAEVIDTYGRSNPNKYRVVVYYLLVKKFGKESVY